MRRRELKKLYPLLKIIAKLDDNEREILIHFLTHQGCSGLYDCVRNGLNNTSLPHTCREKMCNDLKEHKDDLRFLADKHGDPVKKKEVLRKVVKPVGTVFSYVFPLMERDFAVEKIMKDLRRKQKKKTV